MERKAMSLSEVIAVFNETPIQGGRAKQADLLCLKGMWLKKYGFRSVYKSFKEIFGLKVLRHLAVHVLDQEEIPVCDKGSLGEDEIGKAISLMRAGAVLLILQYQGKLAAVMNSEGQLKW